MPKPAKKKKSAKPAMTMTYPRGDDLKQPEMRPAEVSRPPRAPVSADMDVEALLQAQKKRIDGLQQKLGTSRGA